jgi:hypothetical protein
MPNSSAFAAHFSALLVLAAFPTLTAEPSTFSGPTFLAAQPVEAEATVAAAEEQLFEGAAVTEDGLVQVMVELARAIP